MRKTLITAACCLGFAACASALTVSYETEDSARSDCRGFHFTLNASWLTSSEPLSETVFLQEMSVYMLNNGHFSKPGERSLSFGIYEVIGSWLRLVGMSDWVTTTFEVGQDPELLTFSFSGLELSSTSQYRGFFIGNEEYYTNAEPGDILPSSLGMPDPLVNMPVASCALLAGDSPSEGLYPSSAVDINMNKAPVVTFTVTQAVPEPASATLSLLALVGLAAHRRRGARG